jgi:hypothetical protein
VIELRRGSNGQFRVIEAVLATIIIFTTFTSAAYMLKAHRTWATRQVEELEKLGYNTLERFAESGVLDVTIGESRPGWEVHLKLVLDTVLPPSVYYNLTIYSSKYLDGIAILEKYNEQPITNSQASGFTRSPEIAAATYIYTTNGAKIYVLVLQLATGGEIQ